MRIPSTIFILTLFATLSFAKAEEGEPVVQESPVDEKKEGDTDTK